MSSVDVETPAELEPGVYSNFVTVWHSPYEFTLDFGVTMPPEPEIRRGAGSMRIPCRVMSRVKLPVGLMFGLLTAINESMTAYERTFGEISPPGRPDEEET